MSVLLFDTNCLIDLDEGREPRASDLRRIVEAFRRRRLELVAAAISASENAPPGSEKARAKLIAQRLEEWKSAANAF